MVRTEIERDKAHLDTGLTVRVGAEIMHTQGLRAATYIITPVEPGSLWVNNIQAQSKKKKRKPSKLHFKGETESFTLVLPHVWHLSPCRSRPVVCIRSICDAQQKYWYQSLLLLDHQGPGSSAAHPPVKNPLVTKADKIILKALLMQMRILLNSQ